MDSGQRLVERLRGGGLEVVAACWATTEERPGWELYLVTPAVAGKDPRPVFGRVAVALQELEGEWTHPFERLDRSAVTVLAPREPLARGLLDQYRKYPDLRPGPPTGPTYIGEAAVDGSFVYPASLFRPQPAPEPAAAAPPAGV